MTKQEELEVALANAEAALANAVINTSTVDTAQAEANGDLEKARAHCSRVRAALVAFKRLGPTARLGDEFDIHIKQLLDVSKRLAEASPSSRDLSGPPIRADEESGVESSRKEPVHKFNSGFSPRKSNSADALPRRSLIPETIVLFALTFAYLQYYYFEVQLQIVSLPSIFPGALQ